MSRALHLEVTKSKREEEFKEKLNAFIIRCTRLKRIVSDNGAVFRSTAAWINKIRKCQALQDYLAMQQITCSTCLNRHGGEAYIRNENVLQDQGKNKLPVWTIRNCGDGHWTTPKQLLVDVHVRWKQTGRGASFNAMRQHVCQQWKREYFHGLMESHHIRTGARTTDKARRSYWLSEKKKTGENGKRVFF